MSGVEYMAGGIVCARRKQPARVDPWSADDREVVRAVLAEIAQQEPVVAAQIVHDRVKLAEMALAAGLSDELKADLDIARVDPTTLGALPYLQRYDAVCSAGVQDRINDATAYLTEDD